MRSGKATQIGLGRAALLAFGSTTAFTDIKTFNLTEISAAVGALCTATGLGNSKVGFAAS